MLWNKGYNNPKRANSGGCDVNGCPLYYNIGPQRVPGIFSNERLMEENVHFHQWLMPSKLTLNYCLQSLGCSLLFNFLLV